MLIQNSQKCSSDTLNCYVFKGTYHIHNLGKVFCLVFLYSIYTMEKKFHTFNFHPSKEQMEFLATIFLFSRTRYKLEMQ